MPPEEDLEGLLVALSRFHVPADVSPPAVQDGHREEAWRRREFSELADPGGPKGCRKEVVVIMGARSGVGTTFLALNLAVLFAERRRVALGAFAARLADVYVYLGMELQGNQGKAALGRIPVVHPSTGLTIFPVTAAFMQEAWLQGCCTDPGDDELVIVDAGGFDETHGAGFPPHGFSFPAEARLVMVAGPDVRGLLGVQEAFAYWSQGVSMGGVDLVLNRYHGAAAVTAGDFHAVLGVRPAAVIPEDRGNVEASLLAGRPLIASRPASPAAQAVRDMGERLLGMDRPSKRGRRDLLASGVRRLADRIRIALWAAGGE